MTQLADAIAVRTRELRMEKAHHFSTDRRRWLQLALAATWVFDGLLQFQTFMFTKDFSKQILAPTASGNPAWISHSIQWAAHVVASSPVLIDAAFGALQLAIGLAIAWRRSLKAGLAVSIVWSLLVWWFGEGLGGLLTGSASALMGAPGAVLLYLLLAVLLWPTAKSTVGSFVASQPVGRSASKVIWVVLWAGLAALNLQPANLTAGAVHSMEDGMADGQPGWLAALITSFSSLSNHNGIALTVVGTAILILIALSVLLPPTILRAGVISGVVVAAFIWVIGEALGGVYGGQGTDVNSGPLLALIALAYWPTKVAYSATVADGETA
jgi:hypothetical protein